MKNSEWSKWEDLGKRWVKGEVSVAEWQGVKLNPKQIEYVNAKDRYVLSSGGMRSGKTFSFLVKLCLLSLFFPGNRILLGRQTRTNLEKTTLRDFFEVCPPIYEYSVGSGIIKFGNGSEIVTMGLESAASGSDIEGAEQRIKGMNLGGAFIDQAEEVEQTIIDHISSRLSLRTAGIHQVYLTGNPANYWALERFKLNPKPNHKLVEMSMVDNKDNLPPGYLEDQLSKGEMYVNRFVYGKWDLDNLSDKTVFGEDYIRDQGALLKKPIRTLDGIQFYEEADTGQTYQIGVDTSEASEDPCAIIVISKTTGNTVAVYSALVPVEKQVDVACELGYRYGKARIVVESNNTSGGAFIQEIKKKYNNLYMRKRMNRKDNRETQSIGYQTNAGSKIALIEHFKKLAGKNFPKLRHAPLLEEFKTFVWSDEARQKGAGAQRGFHDDLVMATLLAFVEVEARDGGQLAEETAEFDREWRNFSMFTGRYR